MSRVVSFGEILWDKLPSGKEPGGAPLNFAYRLNSFQEALEIGADLYLDTDSYCFIEWPELILPLLNKDVLFLSIKIEKQNRVLTII